MWTLNLKPERELFARIHVPKSYPTLSAWAMPSATSCRKNRSISLIAFPKVHNQFSKIKYKYTKLSTHKKWSPILKRVCLEHKIGCQVDFTHPHCSRRSEEAEGGLRFGGGWPQGGGRDQLAMQKRLGLPEFLGERSSLSLSTLVSASVAESPPRLQLLPDKPTVPASARWLQVPSSPETAVASCSCPSLSSHLNPIWLLGSSIPELSCPYLKYLNFPYLILSDTRSPHVPSPNSLNCILPRI